MCCHDHEKTVNYIKNSCEDIKKDEKCIAYIARKTCEKNEWKDTACKKMKEDDDKKNAQQKKDDIEKRKKYDIKRKEEERRGKTPYEVRCAKAIAHYDTEKRLLPSSPDNWEKQKVSVALSSLHHCQKNVMLGDA